MGTTGHITDLNNKDFRLLKPIPIKIHSTGDGSLVLVKLNGICCWSADESKNKAINLLKEELTDSFIDLTEKFPLDKLGKAMKRERETLMEYIERSKIMEIAQKEMPKYRCHKEVWALKIKMIGICKEDGSGLITPEEDGFAAFKVSTEYMKKNMPRYGGYYVVYKDGYKSFSPAEAFEAGYTLLKGKEKEADDIQIKKGNVVLRPNGYKYIAMKDHVVTGDHKISADRAHGDGDYSYICGMDWCSCMQ